MIQDVIAWAGLILSVIFCFTFLSKRREEYKHNKEDKQ